MNNQKISAILAALMLTGTLATTTDAQQAQPVKQGHVVNAATGKPADMTKPVKVFILLGQSNMVGMGALSGGSIRWGKEFIEPVVSVYPGAYDPKADYDALKPEKTLALQSFGGTEPTPYPGGGTQVVRGFIQPAKTGLYEFNPGYGDSEQNIMVVNGVEVHRKEPGAQAVKKSVKLTAGEKVPFKITYLTEHAGGLGWMTRMDVPGTLNTLVRQQGRFPYLLDGAGNWAVRQDVRFVRYMSGQGPLNNEWMGIRGGTIGPEYGIGHTVGNAIDAPVMILKCCIGNRGLAWDLLPPGSERFVENGKVYAGYKDRPPFWNADPAKGVATEPPPWLDNKGKPIEWWAGLQYDLDTGDAKKALADLARHYPEAKEYEVAGFFFWQGEKDGGNPVHAAHYEKNLVTFIKALRKDFAAPNAKFVLGTMGEAVKGSGDKVMEGQLAVDGTSGKYPEFKGNVATVYTHPMAQGGGGNGHYNKNAEVYMDVGEAMGQAMIELLKSK
jgi:alpha-galactosidase